VWVGAARDLVQRRIRQSFDFVIDDVGHGKSPAGQFAWRFKHRRIIAGLLYLTVTDLTNGRCGRTPFVRYRDAPTRCRPCALSDQRHKYCDNVVRAIRRRDAGSWPILLKKSVPARVNLTPVTAGRQTSLTKRRVTQDLGLVSGSSFASLRRFWAVAASRNSSGAPVGAGRS
jgi:hypothetical protein